MLTDDRLPRSLAIHHSSPRMITGEDINDPTDWLMEHAHLPCPGETSLGPLIKFSRMCRLYADLLAGMTGDASNLRQLEWLELEWLRWRASWEEDQGGLAEISILGTLLMRRSTFHSQTCLSAGTNLYFPPLRQLFSIPYR